MTPDQFVRDNTELITAPLVPELRLHLASAVMPLWHMTEDELTRQGLPPPYWAFAWPGGQALARYILDHPDVVVGRRVLDFGSGSGLVALAAARAGAAHVTAAEIDPFARAAIAANAAINELGVAVTGVDVVGQSGWDIILVGDVCYERPLAERLLAWLSAQDALVLLGDPGRSYFPATGIEKLAAYTVATSRDLEDRDSRETGVFRLLNG